MCYIFMHALLIKFLQDCYKIILVNYQDDIELKARTVLVITILKHQIAHYDTSRCHGVDPSAVNLFGA
jgi:hypothetical protein